MDTAEAAPIEDTQQQEVVQDTHQEAAQDTPERPEWLKEKYKTVEDQAKAYAELERKLGQPKEAPEEYALNLEGELLSKVGMESIEELTSDEMVTGFLDLAKEEGVSQEFVDKVLGWYLSGDAELLEHEQQRQQQEIAALGKRGTERIRDIADFAKQAPEHIHAKVVNMLEDAASVEAFEWFMSQSREAGLPIGDTPAGQTRDQMVEQLQAMQFEKDDNGHRRMSTDPAFAKKVRELREKIYGKAPSVEVVR